MNKNLNVNMNEVPGELYEEDLREGGILKGNTVYDIHGIPIEGRIIKSEDGRALVDDYGNILMEIDENGRATKPGFDKHYGIVRSSDEDRKNIDDKSITHTYDDPNKNILKGFEKKNSTSLELGQVGKKVHDFVNKQFKSRQSGRNK